MLRTTSCQSGRRGSETLRTHPLLEGLDLPPLGGGRDQVLVTKMLLFSAQSQANADGDFVLVARDKMTGDVVAEVPLPGRALGPPVTYLHDDAQYIAITVRADPPEMVAFRLPASSQQE